LSLALILLKIEIYPISQVFENKFVKVHALEAWTIRRLFEHKGFGRA